MRLQEVLNDREQEISLLEAASQDRNTLPLPAAANESVMARLSPNTLNRFEEIRKTVINGHDHIEMGSEGPRSVSEADEGLDRLNELMLWVFFMVLFFHAIVDVDVPNRSMAQKESHHQEVVDTLNQQLAQVRRQRDDLTVVSRDQVCVLNIQLTFLIRSVGLEHVYGNGGFAGITP